MKILMLSAFYPPTIGGIETHVHELSKAIVKKGHDVTVLARYQLGKKPPKKVQKKDGVTIRWIPALFKGKGTITPKIASNPLRWLPVGEAWTKALFMVLAQDYDVIHAHSVVPIGTVASMAQRIKPKTYVCTAHESMFLEGAKSKTYTALATTTLKNTHAIISVSEEIANVAKKMVPGKRVIEISNGTNPEKFKPDEKAGNAIRKRYGIGTEEQVVLCARRLDDPKNGVKFLVKAIPAVLKAHPKTRFLFVGAGMTKQQLKEQLPDHHEQCIIAGPQPNKDMPKFYNAADLVVLPSLLEATSIAGLEAMSCGKTMVGTDVGGIPQIVKPGKNGFLCKAGNPKDLAKTIGKALDADLKKLGKGSRELVLKEFTWSKVADKTLTVYTTVRRERR